MPLQSISPIDGRYSKTTEGLSQHFSEAALMSYRVFVECEYLIALSNLGLPQLRKFSDDEKKLLKNLHNLSSEDAQIISDLETTGYQNIPATNHDVKAVEYFMKLKLKSTSLSDIVEWIHFALTSEDTNNISYALMIKNGVAEVLVHTLNEINFSLTTMAGKYKNSPMLARTHGQPASPTTFGKEILVFQSRLNRQLNQLRAKNILCKLNGASGNYNAALAAYPNIDWIKFSHEFIESLNGSFVSGVLTINANLHTTQIEPHDSYIEIFDTLRHINTILIDFDQDIWRYVSDGWIKQKKVEGEVGSSTMPHKVNPINFENSEGNLGLANSMFEFFGRKLPISRLQRDLSDSTVQRNFGTAFAHCQIAYKYILKGLNRIDVNEEAMLQDLQKHPEVIAEAIQTILRRENVPMPYEKLKNLTRGENLSLEDIYKFVDTLEISDDVKKELKTFTPENYIGLANKIN